MIELGDNVKDKISGFEGIALAKIESLFEATQFRVHPKTLKENGEIAGSVWIEAGRLETITGKKTIGFKDVL